MSRERERENEIPPSVPSERIEWYFIMKRTLSSNRLPCGRNADVGVSIRQMETVRIAVVDREPQGPRYFAAYTLQRLFSPSLPLFLPLLPSRFSSLQSWTFSPQWIKYVTPVTSGTKLGIEIEDNSTTLHGYRDSKGSWQGNGPDVTLFEPPLRFIVEYVWRNYPKILFLENFKRIECNLYTPESLPAVYIYIDTYRSGHVHFHKAERHKGHLARRRWSTHEFLTSWKKSFLERTGDWKPIHSRRAQSWSRGKWEKLESISRG